MRAIDRADWPPMPSALSEFLTRALDILPGVPGIAGMAAGGSFVTGGMDEQSDLDFVIGVDPSSWPDILDRRTDIASSLGDLLACFTGEHVGEPRLMICLYGPPLLHIDLKFVSLDDAHQRVEDPAILWEQDGALSGAFERSRAHYPAPELDWIEERFWIWVHATTSKVERGELLEVVNMLTFIRAKVLGPLQLRRVGARPDGVRRIEQFAPEFAAALERTLTTLDRPACLRAIRATIELYRDLRGEAGAEASKAESEVVRHLEDVERELVQDDT